MSQSNPTKKVGAASAAPFAFCALAGLAGAAGVALAAVAAHKIDSPALATAASMLIVHAAAVLALAAIALRSENSRRWTAVSAVMFAAVALFSGDIALNTLAGRHIFPMAAPTGGSLLIASWLAVAVLSVLEWRGGRNV